MSIQEFKNHENLKGINMDQWNSTSTMPGLLIGLVTLAVPVLAAASTDLQSGHIVDCPTSATGASIDSEQALPQGGLVLFDDLAAFEAAVGTGLPFEGFDGDYAPDPGDALGGCSEPVSSSSDDHCFSPGDLMEGFSLTSTTGGGYVLLGDDHPQVGHEGLAIGPQNISTPATPDVAAIIEFDANDVTAISMGTIPGCNGVTVVVQVFDLQDNFIGSTSVTGETSWETSFLGFISPQPVGRMTLRTNPSGGQLIQDLRFGADQNSIFSDRFEQ
jgi:hypothetical protein